MVENELTGQSVQALGDDAWNHVWRKHVQTLGRQLASGAHAFEIFDAVDLDVAGAVFSLEICAEGEVGVGHAVHPAADGRARVMRGSDPMSQRYHESSTAA